MFCSCFALKVCLLDFRIAGSEVWGVAFRVLELIGALG